jgi:phage terminase large subunit-like protein
MTSSLPDYIKHAIKCGHIPSDLESWKTKDPEKLTPGEKCLRFAADYLVFPEGISANKPLILDPFQCAFILAVFDAPEHISKAILSMARRGGKTLIMGTILLWFIVGGGAKENTLIRSAAMTREQAGLLWRLMSLILQMSPRMEGKFRLVPSSKKIVGMSKNVEYQSLSRDAKSGHGQAIYILVVDECGQIDAPNDDFLDMLFSSMGTYEDSRIFLISTMAPTDAAFFSVEIDTAERSQPKNTVCHVYTAPTDDMMDEKNWYAANPSLYGGYRSKKDILINAQEAMRIPAKQNGFLNLFMNRKVSLQSAFLAPNVWKENGSEPDWEVFRKNGVHIGLDLSMVSDLSCAVISAMDDDGFIHCHCFTFSPLDNIRERSQRDRTPYDVWARDGIIYAPPGRTIDYDMVCQYLRDRLDDAGISINSIEFDRWKIDSFKASAERQGFAQEANWVNVGQGFKDFSVRVDSLEKVLLENKIKHGMNPILTMGAACSVVVSDPTGARKLDKTKSIGGGKIDGIVALAMATYPLVARLDRDIDIEAMIG